MQIFDQQQGDEGCPNLDAQGVFGGSDEGADFQVLLERLEENLDFPAVFVNGRNRGGAEFEVVGQQDDDALIRFVPDRDAPQQMRTAFLSADAGRW
jgi:glutaredoxin